MPRIVSRGTESLHESLPEGTGFEPSVPRGKARRLACRFLFRADFSVRGEPSKGAFKIGRVTRDRWFESLFLQRRVRRMKARITLPRGL
jgi:hypothetical protein